MTPRPNPPGTASPSPAHCLFLPASHVVLPRYLSGTCPCLAPRLSRGGGQKDKPRAAVDASIRAMMQGTLFGLCWAFALACSLLFFLSAGRFGAWGCACWGWSKGRQNLVGVRNKVDDNDDGVGCGPMVLKGVETAENEGLVFDIFVHQSSSNHFYFDKASLGYKPSSLLLPNSCST